MVAEVSTNKMASVARAKFIASARRYVYVWADGVYLQARMEPFEKAIGAIQNLIDVMRCVLVAS